jgi:hypothetical protein
LIKFKLFENYFTYVCIVVFFSLLKTNLKMKKSITVISCCFLLALIFNSCKKAASSNDSANFIGTWMGTGNVTENGVVTGSEPDTITFLAGADDNHVIVQDTGSCSGGTVITCVLSGAGISFPTTTVTDGCGDKETLGITGNLSVATLSLTVQETTTENIPFGSSTGGDTVETINFSIVMSLKK